MVQYINKNLSSHYQDMVGFKLYFPPEEKGKIKCLWSKVQNSITYNYFKWLCNLNLPVFSPHVNPHTSIKFLYFQIGVASWKGNPYGKRTLTIHIYVYIRKYVACWMANTMVGTRKTVLFPPESNGFVTSWDFSLIKRAAMNVFPEPVGK
jgi:hypothetical protein